MANSRGKRITFTLVIDAKTTVDRLWPHLEVAVDNLMSAEQAAELLVEEVMKTAHMVEE